MIDRSAVNSPRRDIYLTQVAAIGCGRRSETRAMVPRATCDDAFAADEQGCAGGNCAATFVDLGKQEWWAKVKLKSGRTVWVEMNKAVFDGVDLLG
jgi:hypothetical protein